MDVGHALGVVEADLASFVVQVDAEAPGPLAGRQGRLLGGRQGLVFLPVGAHAPDLPFLVRPHGFLFAAGRFASRPHRPAPPAPDFHLPVVAAGGETLRAQDAVIGVKTLGVVRQVLAALAQLDAAAVQGKAQARVSGVGVQGDVS